MTSRGAGRRLGQRLVRALAAVPGLPGWGWSAAAACAYALLALGIGFPTGFLSWDPARLPAMTLLGTSAAFFLHPSFTEELLFRALPIPHPSEGATRRTTALGASVGVILFVAAHPLNGLLLRPTALPVFTNPVYLVLAGLLGVACSAAYIRSDSIWPPVLLHWIAVVVWIFLLGGGARLTGR